MNLRDYQQKIVNKLSQELFINKHQKIIVYSATGSGKTIISKFVISKLIDKGKTVLFTVPRRKLAFQTQKLFGFGNILMSTDSENNGSLCTIATIQSYYSTKCEQKFDFVFIDEGHFSSNSEYIKYIKEINKDAKIICLSATPIDANGYLLDGYDAIVNEVDVAELIKLGFLCDVEVYTSVLQPDMSDVEIINGDYNQVQASKKLKDAKILTNTIQEWERLGINKKTLVFACNIEHAEQLKDELSKKYKCEVVHSNLTENEIEANYEAFSKNEVQLLINVDMATFGYDEPSIECLLFARPVKSLRLYKQMVGRGLRIFEGKEKCLIIDCANVIKDNGFPTENITFIKKPIVSRTVDKRLNIERNIDGTIAEGTLTKERIEYLTRISSILDLYADKVYSKESDLQDDILTFLSKTTHFYWRQNSGTANIDGRWVSFTSKKGLPDITLIFGGVFIGIEVKLQKGVLTTHQKETFPELIEKGNHLFFALSVIDLFDIIEHINKNIIKNENSIEVLSSIYELPEEQKKYRNKFKLNIYENTI